MKWQIKYPIICKTHNTKRWVIAIVTRSRDRLMLPRVHQHNTDYLWNYKDKPLCSGSDKNV